MIGESHFWERSNHFYFFYKFVVNAFFSEGFV